MPSHIRMETGTQLFKIIKNKPRRSIHNNIKFILVLGQIFALLPVDGILYNTHERLRFKWCSFKTIYSITALIGMVFHSFMSVYNIYMKGYSLSRTGDIFFNINAAVTIILFIKLAKEWSELINLWRRIERRIEIRYKSPYCLKRKLIYIASIVMSLAAGEHLLSIGFNIVMLHKFHNNSLTGPTYFKLIHPLVFNHFQYSIYLAAIVQVLNLLSTFMWTYSNLFIMVLSISLAESFKQITERLKCLEKINFRGIRWNEIREDYDRLSYLCITLDSSLSYITLLSFIVNLVFVLIQLCKSIEHMPDTISKIYFLYSFGFLLFRTVAVCLFAAEVNDKSIQLIDVLYSVHSSEYNIEVHRLIFQVTFYNVALTGCKFFKITRDLILKIAGAIVTYELILIQFDSLKENDTKELLHR